ncbi:hypothetical protein IWC96_14565 [Brevundimonas sp. BAL450]|uniref:hypothetical protein n=1 Tax=Brevundimonas sp. BAL450 TaxID=1708162 RepID=UPI0018CA5770|nr:hypothetical protein [Brevundimonas sp. BAL450]MBG7616498.1 hypothetical protein [Brevundimonas sp. BAL450]
MIDLTTEDEGASDITGGYDGLLTDSEGRALPMRLHPLCSIFPEMGAADFAKMVVDVKANGVRRPLVLLDGMILDGRHRYLAAREAGVGYRTVTFTGDDPVAFVLSENLQRRHLNESQRAMIAARIAKLPPHRPAGKPENLPTSEPSATTQAQAAGMLNVSDRSVRTAKAVQQDAAPEVQKMVDAGEVSVSAAAAVSALSNERQVEVAGEGAAAVKAAAKEVREERTTERWRQRVRALVMQADDGTGGGVGKVNTPISIAVHLMVKGQIRAASLLAEDTGVSVAGLSAAIRMLTTPREAQEREQRDVAVIVSAIMSMDVEVEEVRETRRTLDAPTEDPLVSAWRSGWADAVLGREPGANLTDPARHDAALEGADAFRRRFADFMATKGSE